MSKLLLSICIATYNRAGYISETLDSIIPQLDDDVELLVVDGASTDNTEDVVRKYAQKESRIRYVRLPTKGGVDQDYDKSVELARGEFCWLFTDDDLLKPGAIRAVLSEIGKNYGLIIVNAQWMDRALSKVLQHKFLEIDTNIIYLGSEIEPLFNRVIPYISFIGCVIINRGLWMRRERQKYFNTEFIHVGVIFQSSLPAPVLLIAEPYIAFRSSNSQWMPRSFEVWMYKWPKLLCSFAGISAQVKQKFQTPQSWYRLKNIIVFRAMGAYSRKDYHTFVASKDLSLWWRSVALFIALTPASFVNFLTLTYFKMAKREALMAIYDLENSKSLRKNRLIDVVKTNGGMNQC